MAKQEYPIDRVEFVKFMGRLETVERHHNDFRETFKEINNSLGSFKESITLINTKLDKLPERVHAIELEKAENRYLNSVVKPFFIFFIGMVCSYVFNNIIFAPKEEKHDYKTEKSK